MNASCLKPYVLISGKTPLETVTEWPGAMSYVPQDVMISNGTIRENIGLGFPIDLVSLSPKFSNSNPKLGITTPQGKEVDQKMIDQHNKLRLNKEAIQKMIEYHDDFHFKPVCNPIEMPEVWEEIEAFRHEMDISKRKTWIMPPGDTREELIRVYPMVMNFCRDNGYNFTGREHIIAFDTQREV